MRAVIFANGDWQDVDYQHLVRSHLRETDLIVAADGGALAAQALGIMPNFVVGDLDSLSPSAVSRLAADGAQIVKHPAGDEATDLDLALNWALDRGIKSALVVGAIGSRLDHSLASLLLPVRYAVLGLDVVLLGRDEIVYSLGPNIKARRFRGQAGAKVSLVPLSSVVYGVTTENLRYPLKNAELYLGSTYSVSNELTGTQGAVSIDQGCLLLTLEHRRVEETDCASGC